MTSPQINSKISVYERLFSWFKLIGITGASQFIIQVISFFSGVLVIRMLPTEEYALYTLANTMLGSITILANSGISTGVTAQGGKVWDDKNKLGVVMRTGLDLKKKFTIISLLIGLPIMVYMLLKNNASWVQILFITAALIPAFIAAISNSVLEVAPKLNQDIYALQKNQLGINVGRLLMLSSLIFFFPFASIAIIASGIPQIIGNFNLRRIALKHANLREKSSQNIRRDILKITKRIIPQAIYYSISGQITIFLLSIFGTTTSVAQIGALGRIAMVLTLFTVVFNTLISPRFARLKEDFKLLLYRYLQVIFIAFILLLVVCVLVYIFPSQILYLLGEKYNNLENEIFLMIVGSCLGLLCGIVYQLYSSRGWILNPIITIIINIGALTIAVFLVDVSTLIGAIYLTIITQIVLFFTNLIYGFLKILKTRENK